jgi:RNA polymerase sigma-70 factor (TIGR02960 family)
MDRTDASPAAESELIAAARGGDEAAFERLAAAYQGRLHAYCYRMLGSVQDADDALQDTLLGAWRGLRGFEGRSSLRSWLYRIATNACLRVAAGRRRRILSAEHGPARADVYDLGDPVREPIWLEPYPDRPAGPDTDPEARYQERESVELAFVAALQHLPARQRAVLILREVLQFPAAEVAGTLETSVASVNSSLQRARRAVSAQAAAGRQGAELRALGEPGQRRLVAALVSAWERADVDALVSLLADDARFSMPPLPAWFCGRADVTRFLAERLLATPWRVVPVRASGQLALACYQAAGPGAPFRLSAINVVTLRDGQIAELTGFLDPGVYRRFGLAAELPGPRESARPR